MGQVPSQALTLKTNPFKGQWAQEQAFRVGGGRINWVGTLLVTSGCHGRQRLFHAHSEVGGSWLSEMSAGSQGRDHAPLALKTRREGRPRWAPDFVF